ncbi:hypothetical protein BSK65_17655 [Paenibacillus odorifer]|uniref:Uncharacterized protein n=1 Tax=Paenibacillus odorifer TaxID=189426 RepID=A0A1R0ZDV8_9BACL|nr:hypothetical protein BSK65_17655 [Paenibacillus odorifer]
MLYIKFYAYFVLTCATDNCKKKGALGAPFALLLSYYEDISRRSTSALNLGNFGACKDTAYQYKRRCDIVKVKIIQVRYVLAATEHTERSLKVNA